MLHCDAKDQVTFLSRVVGLPDAKYFSPQDAIIHRDNIAGKEHIDWGTIISDCLHEKLVRI